jgi:hypothetical protein
MDSHTRRRVLAVAAAAAGSTAGCLGSESSSSESHSGTEGPGRTIPDEQTTTDPATLFRRAEAERAPIHLRSPDAEESNDDEPTDRGRHLQTVLVGSASKADRLVVGSDDSNEELASFVSSTNFDTESLYLETKQIEACFRLSLCYITWQDGIRTAYSREIRPYDELCSVDTKALESRLIRLPVALDEGSINSYGSSVGGGRCRRVETAPANSSNESRRPSENRSQPPNGSESA